MDIEQYLAGLKKYPVLTPEREVELARSSRAGNSESRELFINSNLRLAANVASNYSHRGNLEDLIQQGNLGLVQAADRFDPERGYRFSTYSTWWIRMEILSYLAASEQIAMPPGKRSLRKKIYKIIESHVQSEGKEPSSEYIAECLNKDLPKKEYTSEDVFSLIYGYSKAKTTSLNKPVGDSGFEVADMVASSSFKEPSCYASARDFSEKILQIISQIPFGNESTRAIIKESLFNSRYLSEISAKTGINRETVRLRYHKGIRMLANHISRKRMV